MDSENDLRRAEELVAEGRRIVRQQKGLIVRLRAAGVDTWEAERTLRLFEANLRRFEEHRDPSQKQKTLTTRMDAIGVSCIEAAKTARAQSFDSAPLVPASEPPNEEQSSEPTTSSADVPAQMPNVLDPAKWPAAPSTANTERAPAMNFQVRSQYVSR